MTTLIHRTGNIFDTDAPAIGHGINMAGVMGAGIAAQFRDRFPEMYEAYRASCQAGELKPGSAYPWQTEDGRVIYNITSQVHPGPNASYDNLIWGVVAAIQDAAFRGLTSIALPRIGSGIGGLDERLVEVILSDLATRSDVDIELWTYAPEAPVEG